jgi:hypothetical protein
VRERGPGHARGQRSSAASGGSGPAAAHTVWTRATHKRGRASTGPSEERHGAGVGASERVSTALTSGASSTVHPIQFSNQINFISNGFKFTPNFDRSTRCLPAL